MSDLNKIKDIKKRLDSTTKGDWFFDKEKRDKKGYDFLYSDDVFIVDCSEHMYISNGDGEFIANSKRDIQFLLDEVERLNGLLDSK